MLGLPLSWTLGRCLAYLLIVQLLLLRDGAQCAGWLCPPRALPAVLSTFCVLNLQDSA